MVSNIDTSAICGHMRATLSDYLPDEEIQKVVGELCNQSPSDYVITATEISTVFHNLMQGNTFVNPSAIPHLVKSHDIIEYKDSYGNTILGNDYTKHWLQVMTRLEPGEMTYKIWASLTNLKSAAVITGLSREEKRLQREVISHVCNPNKDVVTDFQHFVTLYTPFLCERLCIDDSRRYDILRSTSISDKASRTLDNERLKPTKRGSRESVDLEAQLRHPVVNRMLQTYPDDAVSCLVYGVDVRAEGLIIPKPVDHELPVGSAAVVPKDAQKPRVVWILLLLLDVMSRPMFHKLEEIESRWTLQGVMDQDGARRYLQSEIKRNLQRAHPKEICSFDQSAFTDNFSYKDIQRPIIQELVRIDILREFDLALLDEINSGEWEASALGLKHETLKFGTGTGMGTPPSFPLASIANGYIVAYCYYKETGKLLDPCTSRPPAKITGDDCTTIGKRLGDDYQQFCQDIGLKINADKSFRHTSIAEFCGKYITSTQILDKKKLKFTSSLSNLKDNMAYYQDHVDQFYTAYPELEAAGIHEVIGVLREIPAPYGVSDKQMSDITVHSTVLEIQAKVEYAKQLANSCIPIVNTSDIREAMYRHWRTPLVATKVIYEPVETQPKQRPGLDILDQSLARDILEAYDRFKKSSSWENLVQEAETIIHVYNVLVNRVQGKELPEPIAPKLTQTNGAHDPVTELINAGLSKWEYPDLE
jgi:hypothetical protein